MKALIATSVASMVDQFLKPSIEILQDIGYEVVVASNFDDCGNITRERCEALKLFLKEQNVQYEQVDFPRNPLKIGQVIKSYKQVSKIIKTTDYSLCHCHSPIGGLVTRLVCRTVQKKGLKVIYTAHGFHFYTGAPLKNWLIYYPVEWVCAHWTDVLITINREDFERAKKRMHAKRVEYVPGVGIDRERFINTIVDRKQKRAELGISEDAFLILSVGELNENKNHKLVIEAISKIEDKNIHYVIAGKGELKSYLEEVARERGVENNVHLLGYRADVAELYKTADLYVLPSKREGLNVSIMEAMVNGLPIVCGSIRGNVDLVKKQGGILCNVNSIDELKRAICFFETNRQKVIEMGTYNIGQSEPYDRRVIAEQLRIVYRRVNDENTSCTKHE